jgi:hypothetical protein
MSWAINLLETNKNAHKQEPRSDDSENGQARHQDPSPGSAGQRACRDRDGDDHRQHCDSGRRDADVVRDHDVVATSVIVGTVSKSADRLDQLGRGEQHEADDRGTPHEAGIGPDTKDRRGDDQQSQGDRGVKAGMVGRPRLREDSGGREQRDRDDDLASNSERVTTARRGEPCFGGHSRNLETRPVLRDVCGSLRAPG